ncbi:major facilitator superfamily domain-containing protein [Lyophyllum atratum]|nr:major facilitator superfamily domain-containing protein [Lyophyllum atratum]
MPSTATLHSDIKDAPDVEKEESDVELDLETSPSEEVSFPEGGWRTWAVVFGVWLNQFVTLGYTNAHGVYNDFYVREYLTHYSSSQISWIGSVQLLLLVSSGLFTGRAFDTGYFYHLMIAGSVLFVVCLFMLSLTHEDQYYQVFLAQGLGLGIASGMTYVPSVAVIAHYFRRRRAFAMGIASSGSALGAALHPVMLNNLFHGKVGFHNGVRASAGLNLGLLVVALLLMKPRLPPSSRTQGSILQDLETFLREPAYVTTIAGMLLLLAGLYFPIFFLQLEAINNGLTPSFAFYTLVIMNGVNTIGRVVPTLLARPLGVFNLMLFSMIALGILILCVLLIKDIPGTVIFTILYGFFSGCYGGLLGPMLASLAKTDAEIGARVGICFTFTGFGGLIGTPIAGALLSSSFIWWRPLVFSSLCMFSGAGFICFTRHVVSKKKGTGWV